MFKRVEIIFSLKHVKGFALYGWTNGRQRCLACVGFVKGAFYFQKISSSLNIIFQSCLENFI